MDYFIDLFFLVLYTQDMDLVQICNGITIATAIICVARFYTELAEKYLLWPMKRKLPKEVGNCLLRLIKVTKFIYPKTEIKFEFLELLNNGKVRARLTYEQKVHNITKKEHIIKLKFPVNHRNKSKVEIFLEGKEKVYNDINDTLLEAEDKIAGGLTKTWKGILECEFNLIDADVFVVYGLGIDYRFTCIDKTSNIKIGIKNFHIDVTTTGSFVANKNVSVEKTIEEGLYPGIIIKDNLESFLPFSGVQLKWKKL